MFLMADPSGKGGGAPFFLFIGGMFFIMWMFMIRPQAKKQKEQQAFIDNLQKGDKVITIAGIHGKINRVNEDGTLQLETSPGSYITIEKTAVSKEMSAKLNAPATVTPAK
jgi:preprotein translocase subunit YajC